MAKFANSKCATQFTAASKDLLSEEERQQIFDNIDSNKNADRIDNVAKQVAGKVLDQKQYEALQTKRTELLNVAAQRKIASRQDALIKNGLEPGKAAEADINGMSGHPGIGERHNAASVRLSTQSAELGDFAQKIETGKLKRYIETNDFKAAILGALWKLQAKTPEEAAALKTPSLDRLKPDQKKAVDQVAQIIHSQTTEHLRQVANSRGAMIANNERYGMAQTHDQIKIRNAEGGGLFKNLLQDKASPAALRAYTSDLGRWVDLDRTRNKLISLGRMDPLKTLDGNQFTKSLWNIFAHEVRRDDPGDNTSGGSFGGGNIASEAEKARILQFKGPEEQAAYDAKYGLGRSVIESHNRQIRQLAHIATALDFYGPSAEANVKQVIKAKASALTDLKNKLSDDPKNDSKVQTLANQIDRLQRSHAPDFLKGFLGINDSGPGSRTITNWENNIKAAEQIMHLGSAPLANIPAFWTGPLQQNYATGMGLFRSFFRTMGGLLLRTAPGSEKSQFLRQSGVGLDGFMSHHAASVWEGYDGTPGAVMKNLTSKFFKFTAFTPLKDKLGEMYVWQTANEMAEHAGKTFDKLPPNMQRHLGDYTISPEEWDVLRGNAVTKIAGHNMLSSQQIRDIPLEAFRGLVDRQSTSSLTTARLDLEGKLANLYHDSAAYATVEPDDKTRFLIPLINGKQGTVGGAVGRMTMQFSTWGFAHGQKVIQRQLAAKSFPEFLATTAAGLLIAGMFKVVASQALQGKNVLADPELGIPGLADRPPTSAAKSAEAWLRFTAAGAGASGLGGQLEDILFSQTYVNGRGNPLQTLAGPAGDDLTQGGKWAYDLGTKGKVDTTQMLRYAQGSAPFINAWYVKPLLNYLVWFGLQEHMDPGSLHRMEQSSKRAGDPYFKGAEPSQAAVRY